MISEFLIMGTPVAPGNRGVMALGASIVDLCRSTYGDKAVAFLQVHKPAPDVLVRSESGDFTVPVITCRMTPSARLRDHLLWILLMAALYRLLPFSGLRLKIRNSIPWVDAVLSAELVGDVRGGDSFSDIYGTKRFVLAFLPVFSVILLRGSMVHFPQTYGPFRTRTARLLARYLLRHSSAAVARDPESQRIAQGMAGAKLRVGLSPDVAFALHPVKPAEIQTAPPLDASLSRNVIGLNINGLMYFGGYTGRNEFGLKLDYRSFATSMVIQLLENYPGEILMVPHTFAVAGDPESDNEASRQVREGLPENLKKRVRIVTGDYDAHELKGIIGQCDIFIGSRMHSCIAALSQGVPCVGVAYSMKFRGVFESVGMEDWVVDGRDLNEEEALQRVFELYAKRDEVRDPLALKAEAARSRLKEVFAEILKPVR
jgi:polysaccharide pyruvyl transferase WcaK-like protein